MRIKNPAIGHGGALECRHGRFDTRESSADDANLQAACRATPRTAGVGDARTTSHRRGDRHRMEVTADVIPRRLRQIDPEKVDRLAESMAENGLINAVTIATLPGDDLVLVAGAHRMMAAKQLGWKWIDAIFIDGLDATDRQLLEIDENLVRAELTPTEQAEHLTKRKELWEAKRNSVAGRNTKGGPGQPKAFTTQTAEMAGVNRSTVHRAIARAEAIPDDVRDQIRGTGLDTGAYLDRLRVMSHDEQRATVQADLAEPGKPAASGRKLTPFAEGCRAWNKMSDAERDAFREWIMDDTCGGMAVDEAIEWLRSALRHGRIGEEHRGPVTGFLRQSKTGRWYPTPPQLRLMRFLLADLGTPPEDLVDEGDSNDG